MKTLQQVAQEKGAALNELDSLTRNAGFVADGNKPQIRQVKKRIEFLTQMQAYMETNPADEYLQREYDRLRNRLEKIMQGEPKPQNKGQADTPTFKKSVSDYRKLMGVSDIQGKLKTLRYLLN